MSILRTIRKMSTEADVKTFFSSPYYAVVGASANTAKYGYKGSPTHPPFPLSSVKLTNPSIRLVH